MCGYDFFCLLYAANNTRILCSHHPSLMVTNAFHLFEKQITFKKGYVEEDTSKPTIYKAHNKTKLANLISIQRNCGY